MAFGRYPSSSIAWRTACSLASLTLGEPRSTNETSDFDTPARSATVLMVAGRGSGGGGAMGPFLLPGIGLDRYIVAQTNISTHPVPHHVFVDLGFRIALDTVRFV